MRRPLQFLNRHRLLACLAVAVAVAPAAAAPAARASAPAPVAVRPATAPRPATVPRPAPGVTARATAQVIATFPRGKDGSFAESLAVDRAGTLYVSLTTWTATGWNRGQVWAVSPDGHATRFGPELAVGVLTGLAFDAQGRLYAGLAAWTDPELPPLRSGVLRIGATSATRVLTLPTAAQDVSSFPNGLAFRGTDLYVSDSVRGAVWRTRPRGGTVDAPTTPWLTSSLLAPGTKGALGVNGIAVRDGALYAVVADSGRLVRIGFGQHGRALPPQLVTRSAALVHADGVAFDGSGRLWVTTNGGTAPKAGAIVRVDLEGHVSVVLGSAPWLDYPTQPVLRTGRTGTTLYVTNGAFNSDGPSTLVAVRLPAVRVGPPPRLTAG